MRKLNKELALDKELNKDSANYSKMNDKLDTIIKLMDSMLNELKKLNKYNNDKIESQSLFSPFG